MAKHNHKKGHSRTGKANSHENKGNSNTKNGISLKEKEDFDYSYKLNHMFRNINPLSLLNFVTDEISYTNTKTGIPPYTIDRETNGRTNYYFIVTSPEYLIQLFENENEEGTEEKAELSEEEKKEQVEACLNFISCIEIYFAQMALDRLPWDRNPLIKRDPQKHKHCFHHSNLSEDVPYCMLNKNENANNEQTNNTEEDKTDNPSASDNNENNNNNANNDLEDRKRLLHQLKKRKLECDKLDLQLFFRNMFVTPEIIQEQELYKNKNLTKQYIDLKNGVHDNIGKKKKNTKLDDRNSADTTATSAEDDKKKEHIVNEDISLVDSYEKRKNAFEAQWNSMSEIQKKNFVENYSLLSLLVKEGGVSYKATNQPINKDIGPLYTTTTDFKKSMNIIKHSMNKSYRIKRKDGTVWDFPRYVAKSRDTFFGKYLASGNHQELDYANPSQLKLKMFTNNLIIERNSLYSSVWANFMEGLINHYMQNEIIAVVERDVCFQLLQPSLKLLYYIKRHDQKMIQSNNQTEKNLLPKEFEPCLKELDDLYLSYNSKEQDRRLEEFVRFAEFYIEVHYIPALVMMLLENVKNSNPNVINIIDGLGPLFFYIESEEDKDEYEDGAYDQDYVDEMQNESQNDSEHLAHDDWNQYEEVTSKLEEEKKLAKRILDGELKEAFEKYVAEHSSNEFTENFQSGGMNSKLTEYVKQFLAEKEDQIENLKAESSALIDLHNDLTEDDIDTQETLFSDFKLFTLCRIFLLSVENKWL